MCYIFFTYFMVIYSLIDNGGIMAELRIFLRDLKEDAQKEVLEFEGLETAEDGNYDIVPLFILEK